MTFSPRLIPRDGRTVPFAAHRSTYPAPQVSATAARGEIIEVILASGLTGRGGASFPTGRKLTAIASGGRNPVVVVNGGQGEPNSQKDKALLRLVPHLVFDGAAQAAAALGATRIIVAIERGHAAVAASVRQAISERRGEAVHRFEAVEVPQRFISGEESALVSFINGGDARPTASPPRAFERGVAGRPTMVSNTETYAHVAQIIRFGPAWFRELGTHTEPGTTLVTMSGAVERPGVYEVPLGVSLRELVVTAGGATGSVAALLMGGFYGAWLAETSAVDARLSNESLRPLGAAVGCGAVAVLTRSECGLRTTAGICTGWPVRPLSSADRA